MSDVIIIGGGPAGSSVGAYLSRAGIDNLIIEGANFPREHVGESLVTSTTIAFRDLGLLEKMEQSGFVRKLGASWHAPGGREASIRFREFPDEGIIQDYTWHVDRGKFDHMLLKHAESLGSKVMQGVRVNEILFKDGYTSGVRVQVGGQHVDIPCRFVVDASGRQTILGRQLRIMDKDPIFDQYAVHAWFRNLDRGIGPTADYIHIYFLPIERGWVWQIPITEDITSVGVVADKNVFRQGFKDLETYFNTHIQTNPDLIQAMRSAERVNAFKTEGDYSYCMRQFVGNGFMLVGDAARFVDPIFSSGVSVAMHSAKFASEHIVHAFETGDFSQAALMPYERKIRGGVEIWYEFIRLYYKLLPLFTHFIQSETYRYQIHQLLQGVVFDRTEVPVLDAMRKYIAKVEASEGHLLKPQLTAIPVD